MEPLSTMAEHRLHRAIAVPVRDLACYGLWQISGARAFRNHKMSR